jgi:hypothetical protein
VTWYFEWDGKTFGPYSATQLKELAGLGRLQPTDMVWKEGMTKRVLADHVRHLFAAREDAGAKPEEPADQPHLAVLEASVLEEAKKLAPSLNPTNYDAPPGEQLPVSIPDGLLLVPLTRNPVTVSSHDDEDEEEQVSQPTSASRKSSAKFAKKCRPTTE